MNWYQTDCKFMRGECGKPNRRPFKDGTGSIHLTRELFSFETCEDGNVRLWIGTKRKNIGYLSTQDEAYLNQYNVGIDRGVVVPVQAGLLSYDFTPNQTRNKQRHERYIKRLERQKAKKQKGSSRYLKCKKRIARRHDKIKNIRKDFCHQTSRKIINDKNHKVIILESLNVQQMTKKTAPKPNNQGGWDKNCARAKAGLNKSILDKGWHQFEIFLAYKSQNAGKALFKVDAKYTSQACAACEHRHPNNRKIQSLLICERCGHTDIPDRNAALVIKKRAIEFIKNTETVLSKKGVLLPFKDKGRGVTSQTQGKDAPSASDDESSKKKRKVVKLSLA